MIVKMMNKQELIDKLKKLLAMPSEIQGTELDFVHDYVIRRAITLVKQLDEQQAPINEPEKPVVPQFVADWYEEHKDNFEYSVQCLCAQGCEPVRQIDIWFDNDDNKPIVTLVKMKLFGYEVEKEKLYLASFRDTNQYLGWNEKLGEWFMSCSPFTSGVEQTQETWEGVGIWNNPAFEIKELEE